MRKTFLIFINSLQRMSLAIAASVAVGVLLCVVTALFSTLAPSVNAAIQVGYINGDNSAVASDFEAYVTQNLGMELVGGDQQTLNNELVEKHISAIVEVPAGFEQAVLGGTPGALQVTYMDDYINKVFLQNYFEMYMGSVESLAAVAGGDASILANLLDEARSAAAPITTAALDEQQVQHEKNWTAFTVGVGFFAFIAALLIIAIANVVYEDRANNTFRRVQASNVSALQYVVGVCAAGLLSIILMVVIFMVYCAASGMGEVVNLAAIGLLCVLFALLCTAFALACGLILQTRSSMLWIVMVTSTVCSLLGGAFFPISYAPDFMQQLAHVTPQFWFFDALYQMHDGVADAWMLSAAILALFSLLFFLISAIRFANSKTTARA
jgi:ABC-2 type transport system permease protein